MACIFLKTCLPLVVLSLLLAFTPASSTNLAYPSKVEANVEAPSPPLSKSGGFFNLGSYFKDILDKFGGQYEEDNDQHSVFQERCRDMSFRGGRAKFVNGSKCYEFFVDHVPNWEAAKAACVVAGGKLWLPDLFDGDLWQCFFVEFPEVFGSANIWLDITIEAGPPLKAVSGTIDVTNAPYIKALGPLVGGQCITINPQSGYADLNSQVCTLGSRSYVCEYDVGFTSSSSSSSGYPSNPYGRR